MTSGLADVAIPWEQHQPDDRGRPTVPTGRLLLDTDVYEAWLVAWTAGAVLEIESALHTHCFCVVDGQLLIADPTMQRPLERHSPRCGGVFELPIVRCSGGGIRTGADLSTVVHVILKQQPTKVPWHIDQQSLPHRQPTPRR